METDGSTLDEDISGLSRRQQVTQRTELKNGMALARRQKHEESGREGTRPREEGGDRTTSQPSKRRREAGTSRSSSPRNIRVKVAGEAPLSGARCGTCGWVPLGYFGRFSPHGMDGDFLRPSTLQQQRRHAQHILPSTCNGSRGRSSSSF